MRRSVQTCSTGDSCNEQFTKRRLSDRSEIADVWASGVLGVAHHYVTRSGKWAGTFGGSTAKAGKSSSIRSVAKPLVARHRASRLARANTRMQRPMPIYRVAVNGRITFSV